MTSPVAEGIAYSAGNPLHTCDCCGAVFRVEITEQSGHNDVEEYYCPECHKEFTCRASISPRVTLISARTDGLTGKCSKV